MKRLSILVVVLACLAAAGRAVSMQDFDIDWYTVDGGGVMWCSGGDFELSGTIGQPDASVVVMSGGDFELVGGFWAGACPAVAGDCDGDGNVDLDDWPAVAGCLGGPGVAYAPDCECADADGDLDVDLEDFAAYQLGFGQ
ncbi:MAG TPA: hypothetical protein PKK06_12840 [Phycisphaerae bacterium]|nr:hypothetical protein [Phycisphaerae bacterium]HNU45522.1 hypothetical protein [Phycisphaerae bacterium]